MIGMKRNSFDITADILRVARGGAKKTWIVHGANLNFKMVKQYLSGLIDRDLLNFEDPYYVATDRAENYLRRYEALVGL